MKSNNRRLTIAKGHASSGLILMFFLILFFSLAGLLMLDYYRYAIYTRRAYNYAQGIAQAASMIVRVSDDEGNQNRAFITQADVNRFCGRAYNWLVNAVHRTFWEMPFYYDDNPPVRVQCAATEGDEGNVFEVMVTLRFEPLFSPFFPPINAFGYSRTRLISGVDYPIP